ncbi:NADP-dependent oxidoreductase [Streptomyces sp. NBC_00322]|uniref:quinone oxidoreductase family protein n=1 Tax=Streptomyces sp. NBC_00322 TaxID=2975712 RepID=UPI002E287710|nr:NADP-dependent oxidoreductase [Streptomyces sp. NBC_00322]
MKRLQYRRRGGPEVLEWAEVDGPKPGPNEIVVDVKAASINPTDIKMRTGELGVANMFGEPFPKGMGLDFAGIVREIGQGVSAVAPGDAVTGLSASRYRGFADLVLIKADKVRRIPDSVTFAEASTLPMGAATAAKVASKYLTPRPDQADYHVAVLGAGGGIGLYTVQFAREAGALVTAVAGGLAADALRSFDLDRVLDYRTETLAASGTRFDTIIDLSDRYTYQDVEAALSRNGCFRTMTPTMRHLRTLATERRAKAAFALADISGLDKAIAAISKKRLITNVGATFPMENAIDVLRDFEEGRLKVVGKVVLTRP